MSSENQNRFSSYIVTFVILLASMVITYSMSTGTSLEPAQAVEEGTPAAATRQPSRSRILYETVFLAKNVKLLIGRTCFAFKGIEKKTILVDLYLLDLDNEQPYPKKISRKAADEEVRLGDYRYQVVSANDTFLRLKLLNGSLIR